jgi:hypothetical protein
MPVLDELGTYLQAQGVGILQRDIFLGVRPASPDECLTLAEYPGGAPEYVQESASPRHESVQIQIVSRGVEYQRVRLLASLAWSALSRVTNSTLSGVRYLSIRPSSSPAPIGRDSNGQLLIGFNCTVVKEAS